MANNLLLEEWLPTSPSEGPPLPKFLGILWPWASRATLIWTPGPPFTRGSGQTATIEITNLPRTEYLPYLFNLKLDEQVYWSQAFALQPGDTLEASSYFGIPPQPGTYSVILRLGDSAGYTLRQWTMSPMVVEAEEEELAHCCPYCTECFASLDELIDHVSEKHPDKPPLKAIEIEWKSTT